MNKAELAALERAAFKIFMERALAFVPGHPKGAATIKEGTDQEMIGKHLVRLIEAGIRYGWASRGLFDIRPLKQEKVDDVMEEIVRAYMQGGFPRFGRADDGV